MIGVPDKQLRLRRSKYATSDAVQRRLEAAAGKVLVDLHIKNAKAAVFLLKHEEMRRLKVRFASKKCRGAIDVLAFPEPSGFPHPEESARFLGEIYVNKNLAKQGYRHLKFLVVHGLLHLLGYSHEKKSDIVKMERMEKKFL